ncbi:alanyl-tRNA editing protein [Shewanella sp. NIFS-20-20]|uniref:alanyl-tRNA editing protein n=1 Tax=Shewanella sp. NIFS-20-20 TaxID=2853806 RepID=UPI001C479B49|nr:alanyl-tRNA editing protein [Shewanella sp. NIFS-20-20]MBV7316000.1 alanyl-tRNA editing protein [Shewanella sp. NIFS-20-20]
MTEPQVANIPMTATQVTFTQPIHCLTSPVLYCLSHEHSSILITAATPFHPISHLWPDHPADRGHITIDDVEHPLIDCLTGAWDCEQGRLFIDKDIPVKRCQAGWIFVVVHRIQGQLATPIGTQVQLSVDTHYQQALSRGHSGAHLAALALNKVLHHDYWRKAPTRIDALGHFDFHNYAEETSVVSQDQCVDRYRLGKTLKKRGFNSDSFIQDLPQVTKRVNQQLQQWRDSGVDIGFVREGECLSDSRYWQTTLDEQLVSMPCGGTHVQSMRDLGALTVELSLTTEGHIDMVTHTACP